MSYAKEALLKQANQMATDIATDPDLGTDEKCHLSVRAVFDILDGKTAEFPACDIAVVLDPTDNPTIDAFFSEHFTGGEVINSDRDLGAKYSTLVSEAAAEIADEETGDDVPTLTDDDIPF